MEPAAAHTLCNTLLTFLGSNWNVVVTVTEALGVAAGRLDPTAAAALTEALVTRLTATTDRTVLAAIAKGLEGAAARLDREPAARLFDRLCDLVGQLTDPDAHEAIITGLYALAPKLAGPDEHVRLGRAVEAIIAELSRVHFEAGARAVGRDLPSLIDRLDLAACRRVGDRLLERLGAPNAGYGRQFTAAESLAAVVRRLDPVDDRAQIERIAAGALRVLSERPIGEVPYLVGELLAAAVTRLSPSEVDRITERLLKLVQGTDRHEWLAAAVRALEAAVARPNTDPTLAARVTRVFFRAVERPENTNLATWAAAARPGSLRPILRFVNDPADLAVLLTSPSCTGEFQSAVLERLEELAFPRPFPPVAMIGLAVPMCGVGPATTLATLEQFDWQARRRFRTPWDAADWLEAHRPDIDLNSPFQSRGP